MSASDRIHPASSDDERQFVEVVVLHGAAHGTETFHYLVPDSLKGVLRPGHMVWAPFGQRVLAGIALALVAATPVDQPREVGELIDPDPVLTETQIALARWMARYYFCPLWQVMSSMLPSLAEPHTTQVLSLTDRRPQYLPTDSRFSIVQALAERGPLSLAAVRATVKLKDVQPVIRELIAQGALESTTVVEAPAGLSHRANLVRLAVSPDEARRGAAHSPGQKRVIEQALAASPVDGAPAWIETEELIGEGPATRAAIAALLRRGVLEATRSSGPAGPTSIPFVPGPALTAAQDAAWRRVQVSVAAHDHAVFLLHGATGSGKTEVYFRAMQDVLAEGRAALLLLPEIALTPQMFARVTARFPRGAALWHSRLTALQQYEVWDRVRSGRVRLIVGSRSAVMLPLRRLGLIVVDEEHEWSYKHDDAPRYHARDAAIEYARLAGAVVVLGSATPDVSSYQRAISGTYRLLTLPERYQVDGTTPKPGAGLPAVRVVDMRRELRAGNRSMFSQVLQRELSAALERCEQAILLLNRRGAATVVLCRECGYVARCSRCEVPYTYHAAEDTLLCHRCGQRRRTPEWCPQCGSGRIRFLGAGTETVAQEVAHLFPRARVLRWDSDSTVAAGAHRDILTRFAGHEADVLVGTQMVAKGLDVANVTLVGVVNADVSLHLPDFRSGERTFQLLMQVAGRAGRGERPGKAIIQTYTPDHYCIQAASRHDYGAFFSQEAAFRRRQGYPPFAQLAKLVYRSTNESRCEAEASAVADRLREVCNDLGWAPDSIIGPAPAFIHRLRTGFRWQIIIRASSVHPLLERVTLKRGWAIDVDPASTL